jgi:hypothetical protein
MPFIIGGFIESSSMESVEMDALKGGLADGDEEEEVVGFFRPSLKMAEGLSLER